MVINLGALDPLNMSAAVYSAERGVVLKASCYINGSIRSLSSLVRGRTHSHHHLWPLAGDLLESATFYSMMNRTKKREGKRRKRRKGREEEEEQTHPGE